MASELTMGVATALAANREDASMTLSFSACVPDRSETITRQSRGLLYPVEIPSPPCVLSSGVYHPRALDLNNGFLLESPLLDGGFHSLLSHGGFPLREIVLSVLVPGLRPV